MFTRQQNTLATYEIKNNLGQGSTPLVSQLIYRAESYG